MNPQENPQASCIKQRFNINKCNDAIPANPLEILLRLSCYVTNMHLVRDIYRTTVWKTMPHARLWGIESAYCAIHSSTTTRPISQPWDRAINNHCPTAIRRTNLTPTVRACDRERLPLISPSSGASWENPFKDGGTHNWLFDWFHFGIDRKRGKTMHDGGLWKRGIKRLRPKDLIAMWYNPRTWGVEAEYGHLFPSGLDECAGGCQAGGRCAGHAGILIQGSITTTSRSFLWRNRSRLGQSQRGARWNIGQRSRRSGWCRAWSPNFHIWLWHVHLQR